MIIKKDDLTYVRAVDGGSAEAPPVLGDSAFRGVDPRVHELQERAEVLERALDDLDSSLLEQSAGDVKHAKRTIAIRSWFTPLTTIVLGTILLFTHGAPWLTMLTLFFALYSGLSLYSFVKGYKLPISSSDPKKQRRILHSEAAYYIATVMFMVFVVRWYFWMPLFKTLEFISAAVFCLLQTALTNWPRALWAHKALKIGKQRKAIEEDLATVRRELAALLGHGETEPPASVEVDLDARSVKDPNRGRR